MNRKERRAGRKQSGGPAPGRASSSAVEQLFATAIQHHQAGELQEAEKLYLQILEIDKNHTQSLHHLGLVAHQIGQNERAVELMERAILQNDRLPEFHYNIAVALQALGRLDEAVWHNERTLALKPDYAAAHNNLGTVLQAKGEYTAAAARHRQALALNPDSVEAHYSLGNAYSALRQWDRAIESYNQALTRWPDLVEARDKLGAALKAQGKLEEAEAQFQQVQALKRDQVEALNARADAFIWNDRPEQALPFIRRALSIQETGRARLLFGDSVRALRAYPTDTEFRGLLIRAMSDLWHRPNCFAGAAVALIKRQSVIGDCIKRATDAWSRPLDAQELYGPFGLAAVAKDSLLRCHLEADPNWDLALERFLTAARRVLLQTASSARGSVSVDDDVLGFYCALAKQCFINEYVFSHTDEELNRAQALRDSLGTALDAGGAVPLLWLAAVAAYFPLGTVPAAQSLLDRAWPDAVTALLMQQIQEPAEERQYRSTIPRLTTITDDVSLEVRQQYEENPYPRWVKASIGREPITGARVLAVDLSLTSLGYAARMTRRYGIEGIEYAQADIMALGSIGRTFDIIEAGGVLHHLADPLAGWRVLLSLLRPGGLMSVGLYSELGRSDIKAAQAYVAAQGYGSTADDIRRCRQELVSIDASPQLQRLAQIDDFFSTSGCRDLLFHVQEHRFDIPQIATLLPRCGCVAPLHAWSRIASWLITDASSQPPTDF